MKTLIVFVTKTGVTEDCAQKLKMLLGKDDTDLVNLKVQKLPDFTPYDCIILGSYLRYGRIGERLRNFMTLHKEMLLEKKLGIFLCKALPDDEENPFEENFRKKILGHAAACGDFGGRLDPDHLKGASRSMMKMVLQGILAQNRPLPQINDAAIEEFAKKLQAD